jgi:hypothetical protein
MEMITPPIGRLLDTSQQRCGFSPGDTDATTCNTPATWHICWGADLENGLACDEHMVYAQRYAYLDRHEITPDCSMPGSSWDFDGHRCLIEGVTDPEAAALALASPTEVP